MLLPRRTITKETTLTMEEIKQFADAICVGDVIPAIIRKWDHKSSNIPVAYEVPARVKVLRKYPNLVGTNQGVFPWKDIVIGYYNYNGPSVVDEDSFVKEKPARGRKKKAA